MGHVLVLILNVLRLYWYITSTFSIYAVKIYLFVVNLISPEFLGELILFQPMGL